jgi:hypothetical protein
MNERLKAALVLLCVGALFWSIHIFAKLVLHMNDPQSFVLACGFTLNGLYLFHTYDDEL